MQFTLGTNHFAVHIAARPLLLDGSPCLAKLDRVRRRIWISDQLPRSKRREELFHELRHVWVDVHGRPSDDEEDAVNAAQMMGWLMEQYLQQGGDTVLESLDPLPDVPIGRQGSGAMPVTQAQCGHCRAPIATGSVASDPPTWDPDRGNWAMDRGAYCEGCDHVTAWRELCTAEGMPIGEIVSHPGPRVLRGEEHNGWTREHPAVVRAMA